MAPTIEVAKSGPGNFKVTVKESGGQTIHRVCLKAADYQRLTGGKASEEELLELSFQFLLSREPKEAILREFDLSIISQYFPQYESAIKQRLRSHPSSS